MFSLSSYIIPLFNPMIFLKTNISKMAADTAMVAMEGEYKVIHGLSNHTISNDLE